MLNKEAVAEAIKTGHKASSILLEVITELYTEHKCPEAAGYDGLETYPDCGVCVYCIAGEVLESIHIPESK